MPYFDAHSSPEFLLASAAENAEVIRNVHLTGEGVAPLVESRELNPEVRHDDDPVIIEDEFVLPPNWVALETWHAVRQLENLGGNMGLWTPLSDAEIISYIRHERQHELFARKLGIQAIVRSIQVFRLENGHEASFARTYGVNYPGMDLTRLEFAILAAGPEVPSSGDVNLYKLLGYESVEEIAAKAREQGKPVPLSAQNPVIR